MSSMSEPIGEQIRRAPKVLLHDHLDGGLRPGTILDLAPGAGHTLPADDPATLRQWFEDSANSGSLERYLETFDHTVAVMQSAENLRRVARECVADLAADGVVYAEVRYAPEQHLRGGLSLTDVVGREHVPGARREVEDRLGPQPAVEVVVEQDLRRAPDLLTDRFGHAAHPSTVPEDRRRPCARSPPSTS